MKNARVLAYRDADWLRARPRLLPLPPTITKSSRSVQTDLLGNTFITSRTPAEDLNTHRRMKMNESLHAFDFERQFNDRAALEWFEQNCVQTVFQEIYDCSDYLMDKTGEQRSFCPGVTRAFIFFGRLFMKDRQKLDLRKPLMLWSLCLAIFSVMGAMRTGWYMFSTLRSDGLRGSVCDTDFYSAPVSKFWAFAFTLSKAPELGDTVFIVLRKQRLIFLHWYHHITVLLYTWYTYKERVAGGGWFMTMNYTVHAFMYSYYTAKASGARVPRLLAVLVTLLQIAQMLAGLSVLGLVWVWKHHERCFSTTQNMACASLMYLSYLLLFSVFFYQSYLRRSGDQKRDKRE
ncbi:elongation of very long chain fatty acids protein 6-like [Puntigrus tetrazona]|uniref:elongation of very long chain fatty acids protein 6-like n=1 Tax=Puntigrus tetrazona TaxID=1606681 RepID=UPI001C8A021A|nr:elongation of very long chain fatty acids protein 6-like [Puntigrus tetrazona]